MRFAAVVSVVVVSACTRAEVTPFHELDTDRDGRITEQEATRDVLLSELFTDVDGDGNGELTALEYLQAANQQ